MLRNIKFSALFLLMLLLVALVASCGSAATSTPVPTSAPTAPPVTATSAAAPTSIDAYYGTPATYSRQLGARTQTIRLGVSPDFATRPLLPFYGLSLTDDKFKDTLFQVITYNHFFRWQEADWDKRKDTKFDDFKAQLEAGQELSYPVMDTSAGGTNAHIESVNPAADLDILLIPHHDGFITFPGSASDPGLSIKNTIKADGSMTVRAPLVYGQTITMKEGSPALQDLTRTAIILSLMQTSIPPEIIANHDVKAINTWWQTEPEADLHAYQYEYLKKLLSDQNDVSIIRLWDAKPTTP